MLCCFTASHSYSDTTGNLLDPSVIEGTYNNCTPGVNCWNGTTGGYYPNWDGTTAYWGYGGGTLRWNIAFQQALESVGIQLDGFNYSWYIKNSDTNAEQNDGDDYMRISVRMYDESGTQLWGKQYNYDGTYQWSNFTGQELFTTPLPIENVDKILIRAEGDDPGFWAGYYGPEFDVSASSFTLIYSADPCYTDPLSSPTCDGYANAIAEMLAEQQALISASLPTIEETTSNAVPDITTETNPTTLTTTPTIASGGTRTDGQDTGDTGSVPIEETGDKDDDKKEKLDLARSLDATNNFDVSSVSGAPSAMEDQMAMDIVSSVEQQTIGGTLNGSMDQTISGLGGLPSSNISSVQDKQTSQTREQRQERREKLKELVDQRANEISDENSGAESMDEQSKQQMEQLALMNYVPGFNTYSRALNGGYLPDAVGYPNSIVPESRKGLRNGLAQQLLHEQMVDMQYERSK